MRYRETSRVLKVLRGQLPSVMDHAYRHFIGVTYRHVNRPRLFSLKVGFKAISYDKKGFSGRLNEICRLKTDDPQKTLEKLTKKKQPSVWEWLNAKAVPDRENLLKIIEWGETTSDYLLYARGPRRPEWIFSKARSGDNKAAAANDPALAKLKAAKLVHARKGAKK